MGKTEYENGTVVTPEFLNSMYLTDGGHVHDGDGDGNPAEDGHAPKIDLASHVHGELPAANIGDHWHGGGNISKINLLTGVIGTLPVENQASNVVHGSVAFDSYFINSSEILDPTGQYSTFAWLLPAGITNSSNNFLQWTQQATTWNRLFYRLEKYASVHFVTLCVPGFKFACRTSDNSRDFDLALLPCELRPSATIYTHAAVQMTFVVPPQGAGQGVTQTADSAARVGVRGEYLTIRDLYIPQHNTEVEVRGFSLHYAVNPATISLWDDA